MILRKKYIVTLLFCLIQISGCGTNNTPFGGSTVSWITFEKYNCSKFSHPMHKAACDKQKSWTSEERELISNLALNLEKRLPNFINKITDGKSKRIYFSRIQSFKGAPELEGAFGLTINYKDDSIVVFSDAGILTLTTNLSKSDLGGFDPPDNGHVLLHELTHLYDAATKENRFPEFDSFWSSKTHEQGQAKTLLAGLPRNDIKNYVSRNIQLGRTLGVPTLYTLANEMECFAELVTWIDGGADTSYLPTPLVQYVKTNILN